MSVKYIFHMHLMKKTLAYKSLLHNQMWSNILKSCNFGVHQCA